MINNTTYKRLLDNMAEAVWMGDKDEKTIYANPQFCELVGYSLDEMLGKESYIFWDKESIKTVKDTNTKRKKGVSSSYYWNLLTKAWKLIPVKLNGTPIPDGGTIGIMTDLRELKEKEESEKILYNAIQYSTDAIVMCDQDGNISSWNKGAQLIFGFKESDILWENLSRIFSKKDLHYILQTEEQVNKYELTAKHKNKSFLHTSVTQTHIYDNQSNETGSYLLICRDITGHRKIEEEIESKYKKIRDVYQNIGVIKRQSDYIFDLLNMYENYHADKKSIWDFIVTSIIMLTHVDGCELRLYNKEADTLEMISHFWFSQDWSGKKKIRFQGSLAQQAYQNGKPLKIIDLLQEPKYQTPALARKHGMTSLLLIPLKAQGKFIGILSLYTKADKKLEIFENEFIEKYAKVIQLVLAD